MRSMTISLPIRVLFTGLLSLLVAMPVQAQSDNIETVEGPSGEKITLTAEPHSVADGLSVRARRVVESDTTRWALSLIGASPEEEISLRAGNESRPIERVRRPDDGIGPTDVFVSQETFLTLAETDTATLQIGNVTASLPAALRQEMTQIAEGAQ